MSLSRLLARARGGYYRAKYGLLGKAEFKGPILAYCRLEIQGPGKVFFGRGCVIRPHVFAREHVSIFFSGPGAKVVVGDGVVLRGSRIGCSESVEIGDRAVVEGSSLFDTDFHSTDASKRDEIDGRLTKPLVLGSGSYVAMDCMLGKGTVAEPDTVFLPNTIMSWKTTKAGAVYAGVPGRIM
jgi:acetyltransferase-like isoleucine patch superfamily enzyme